MIMTYDKKQFTRREVLIKIKEILREATSNVFLVVPTIEDTEELQLYEIKSSTNIRVACAVNFLGFHSELLDEIESLENIILRDYKEQDRYVINRDNEELFIAVFILLRTEKSSFS